MKTADALSNNVLTFSPSHPIAVVIDAVDVRRGHRTVLRDVGFFIPRGSVTVIVGPSGAGKTTLVGVLNGLIRPFAGTVALPGLGRLDHAHVLQAHRQQTATVFQEHALIDRLSALDNVLLGLADQRHPLSLLPWSRVQRTRAALALKEVGLLHRAFDRAGRLSGGERQRVGLARALVRKPRLLLADEPFASVDPGLVGELSDAFRQAVDDHGVTLVIVLHQIATARAIADRIIGLADGRVQFNGPVHEFDEHAEDRLFFNSPSKTDKKGFVHA